MIWKGLSLTQSAALVSGTIHSRLSKSGRPGDLFENLMNEIQDKRAQWVEIEVVKYFDTALDMLKTEYELLQKEKNNKNCLNGSFDSYIPQWIPIIQKEDFLDWVKKQTK